MSRTTAWVLAAAIPFVAIATHATAKLDPPSPEEQAAAQKKVEIEKQQIKQQQEALSRVQDEVAARYHREHPNAGAAQPAGETPKEQVPRAARDLPRDAGPHGRDEPSAEAHSAPAGTPQPPGRR